MSAGSGPLTAQHPIDPAQAAQTAPSISSTVPGQKRPFEAESQHVGPNGQSQFQQGTGTGNANNAGDTAPSEPRSRPIIKMKRTGHSGPFPLSGRPVFPPTSNGKQNTPSPSISSAPTPASIFFSGPFLNDFSCVSRAPQEQTINKPVPELSLDIPDSKSPRQSPLQTPMSLMIGGRSNMDSDPSSKSSETPDATDILRPEPTIMSDSNTLLKPSISPDVQEAFDSALDDRPYKVWTDETGKHLPTAGALLPPGYQQSDDPFFPWLCPVRSCRKLLPTLPGLGKHFCNSHRATRFNDNLDGTLTDLGTYSDPTHGNGRRSNGFARPALLVSKRAMTLDESPMAEITLHLRTQQAAKATNPQRGGPHRRPTLSKATPKDDDDADTEDEPPIRGTRSGGKPQRASPAAAETRRFDMANPDRPYNMWLDNDGTLIPLITGLLIPDGYKHDTTVAGRPWVCPVRTCRRLFKGLLDLANHFRPHHRGTQLNDNLDGTFSIIAKSHDVTPAIVVSRDPMDFEDIAEPSRPVYPSGMTSKRVVWVKAAEDNPAYMQPRVEAGPDIDAMDLDADADLEFATKGRPYREWRDDSGKLVSMAGALIPEGYDLDDTFPGRPWICPVRSCRIVCKLRRGLGYHFMTAHRSTDFNDNGNGTLSVVGSHSRHAPRVVSKKPLGVNGEPLSAPRLPPTSQEALREVKRRREAEESREKPLSSSVSLTTHTRNDSADKLWQHICSLVDLPTVARERPEVTKLLRLPKMRDLDIVPSTLAADLNPAQIVSVIIQTVGEESLQSCSECRRHDGPFHSCVSLSAEAAQNTYSLLASSSRACANCIVRKNSSACSIRKQGGPWEQTAKQNLRDIAAGVDTPMLDDEDILTPRRRSLRLFLTNADESMDEEQEESADEAPPEPERRSSRLVTLKVPQPTQNGRQTRERPPPREKDLHMEDWEMDAGRVNKAGEALAFSSTYLVANQTVQVAPKINFQAITILSGRAHQFQADSTKTRICTLASGKLKVQVGGDEFVIGAQGIFKIVPGKACTVTNRCYFDLVLHVTSVNGA